MAKRKIKSTHILVVILFLLAVSQAFTIYLIYAKSHQSTQQIQQTEESFDEKLTMQNQDLQSKINEITNSLTSITSTQESFQEQIGEIKAETSSDFSGIIENELKGVVTIKTDISQGTGFIITEEGYIVTNYHVMQGAKAAGIFTYDSEQYLVQMIGQNTALDIALLKINENNLHSLELGDSDDVKVGEKVIAIGNPLGLSFTATEGIISARDREGSNGFPYYFQIDVPLNPGNSGGPLINTKGKVIGINNFKVSGAESLGFALESNIVRETVNDIALAKLNQTIV
jgi:S1-C subfamily serine protease